MKHVHSGQSSSPARPVHFRLQAESIEVAVRLRRYGDRWIAVTEAGDDREIGLASTPRVALVAAVSRLRPKAAAALLVDLQLLGVSLQLA